MDIDIDINIEEQIDPNSRKKFVTRAFGLVFLSIALPVIMYLFRYLLTQLLHSYGETIMWAEASLVPIGVVIIGVFIFKVTRQRLHDLNLSDVFLLVFPFLPIFLFTTLVSRWFFGGRFMRGNALAPYIDPTMWLNRLIGNPFNFYPALLLGIACMIMLALISSEDIDNKNSLKMRVFFWVQSMTECKSKINKFEFQKKSTSLLSAILLLTILPLTFMTFIVGILGLLIPLALIPLAVRRLNDMNYHYSFVLPLFFTQWSILVLVRYVGSLIKGQDIINTIGRNPLDIVIAIINMLLIAWLMTAKSADVPKIQQA